MTVQACDRCTALNQQDDCDFNIRVVTIEVTMNSESAIFQDCTTSEQAIAVAREHRWSDWMNFNNREQSYCERWLRYCDWHDETYVIPVLGHEFVISDHLRAAMRSGELSIWAYSYIFENESPWSYYNSNSNSDSVCRDCYDCGDSCEDCGERFPEGGGDLNAVNGGNNWVCEMCLENYSFCEDHDHYYSYACYSCERDGARGGGFIHNYSFKPDPEFKVVEDEHESWMQRRLHDFDFWRRSRKYHVMRDSWLVPINTLAKPLTFMGFELEVEAPNSRTLGEGARHVGEGWSDFLYLKQDGSLVQGMEIVSHPMTLRAHKELIDWSFLGRLTDLGFKSFRTNTCGLHVHVNRAAFDSDTHVYKFARLFGDNAIPMQRLGGRDSARWGTFDNLSKNVTHSIKNGWSTPRYQAINFNNNSTLELRFFKGTLRTKRIHSALELVDAAVEYTRQLETRTIIVHEGFSFIAFAEWVGEQPQYSNLAYFINIFGLKGPKDNSWENHDSSNEMEV